MLLLWRRPSSSPEIIKIIMYARSSLDLDGNTGYLDKHVKRIHRALDSDDVKLSLHSALESDDVKLVRTLLKEGHETLDDAHVLHYAFFICDLKIAIDLLELGIADVQVHRAACGCHAQRTDGL